MSEHESENANSNHVKTLTGRYESDEECGNEGVTYQELADSYKEICIGSGEVIKTREKHENYSSTAS